VKELKNIKPELTAVYNDLKSTKRMLQYKTESQETLNSENTKLKEHVKELEKTFFDEIDEDSEKCLPQTKSSEQLS
jgi:regulator of replication initiation timing